MKVPSKIIAMFDRSKELYAELMEEYKKCIETNEISNKARIITHEVIEKCRHALDHSIRVYWNKNYSHLYSHKNIYFPITQKVEHFKVLLGRQKMWNLVNEDSIMYDFLLNCQVFSDKRYQWLYYLTKLAGQGKHEEFSEQTRKDFDIHTVESYGGIVSWAEDLIRFNPTESKDIKISILGRNYKDFIERSNYDPNITHKIKRSISFRIGNDNRDVITILNEIIRKTCLLIQEFFKLI